MTPPGCVVCVPARDEAGTLPALIAALGAQEGLHRPLRAVILANNCTDGTAAAARDLARRAPSLALRVVEVTLPPDRALVGVARDLALRAGAAWLREEGEATGAVLVTTDADAVPPPRWIAATLAAMEGAEAVGGEIRLAEPPGAPLPPWLREARARVARYWSAVRDLAHRLDPLPHDPPPRHGDHTGASLAVTLAAFEAAGGVPHLRTGEDNALVAAIERQGGRLRHPPEVWTAVSVREDGRAPGGMAEEMRKWRRLAESGEPHLLPDAAFWAGSFARRRALRDAFRAGTPARAAAETGAPAGTLDALARDSVNDIAFVSRAEPLLPPLAPDWVDIGAATAGIIALADARPLRDVA